MDNVFDILLRSKRRQREGKERLESILNSRETNTYNEEVAKQIDTDEDLEFRLGETTETTNHISDINKLSMRDLDKESKDEQLKILKLEYNRLYDKLVHLNELLIASESNVNNLMIDKREDEKRIKELRFIIRNFANSLPGNPELKELVSRGGWDRDDVANLIIKALNEINHRLQNFDKEIESRISEIYKENVALKEEILKNKEIISKIEQLERLVYDNTEVERPKEQSTNEKENPSETKQEDRFSKKGEVSGGINDANRDEKEQHKPHFGDFFNEFEKSYRNEEGEGTTSINDKMKEEKNDIKAAEVADKVKEDASEEADDKKHPLSPDFVETEKQEVSALFDGNLNSYLNTLSDNQKFILKIIGETGISRNPDLRDYLRKHEEGFEIYRKGNGINYQQLSSDVAELRGKNILDEDKLSLGGRGGGANIIVYQLSEVGKQCYKYLFDDNPVVPERKRILDLHGSLEHGYLIKDSSVIFKELGYKVYTDLKDVTVYTKNNKRKVFDFVIENNKKEKKYIEVEMGTHNKDDFFYALDRIYSITDHFYFICPNDKVKDRKIKQMFFNWVNEKLGGINNANVVLNITTINQLRRKPKHIWEVTDLRNIKK